MDNYSCSLVVRNKPWFNSVVPLFQDVWNTILKERVTGYEHRKPKKKQKKTNVFKINDTDKTNKEENKKHSKSMPTIIKVDI